MNTYNIIQKELMTIRIVLGYTQEEFAKLLGVSRPTYLYTETKKKEMSRTLALSLYAVLAGHTYKEGLNDLQRTHLKRLLTSEAFKQIITQFE